MSRERKYFEESFFPPGMVRDDQVYYWYISDGTWTVVEDTKLEEYRVPGKIYKLQAVTRGNYELLYYSDEVEDETMGREVNKETFFEDYRPVFKNLSDKINNECETEEEIVTRKFKEKGMERCVFSSGLEVFLKTPDEYLSNPKYREHLSKMLDMHELYYTKNEDYGDSFINSLDKYGPIAALVRMEDKMGRLSNLISKGEKGYIKSESVEDTLIDLANYAIMTSLYLRGNKTDD